MIDTNARTGNGIAVVRGPSLHDWLVRRLGENAAGVGADEPAGVVFAAQARDEVNGPEPRHRDTGATSAQWVRLT